MRAARAKPSRSLRAALDALRPMVKAISRLEVPLSDGSKVVPQILLVVCVWLVLCVIAMFELGLWPRTKVGWALTVGLGPVAYLTATLAAEFAMKILQRLPWARRSRDWVERRTSRKRFSWLRVGYALVGCLSIFLVALALWVYDESRPDHEPGPIKQFIARHFR